MSYLSVSANTLLAVLSIIALNVAYQFLARKLQKTRPPVVFHWLPFIGSTIQYGMDPYRFFFSCRQKYGDIFTFVLLGRPTTVYLGTKGNEFILNGKLKDINAEEVYGPLTTPVFGSDVCYDCPNSKLMEQKKFIKFGLSQAALEAHVPLIEKEVRQYLASSPNFAGTSGEVDISAAMAEITIFTAGSSLQGEEVRSKLTTEFAVLYHDLDKGFTPINFMLPWAPLPHNKKRDIAHARMRSIYEDIITKRRLTSNLAQEKKLDMIGNLMHTHLPQSARGLCYAWLLSLKSSRNFTRSN
ncbi:hypothetical protein DV738_g4639, partial [Chaetothyriales sp. CBS 135597]